MGLRMEGGLGIAGGVLLFVSVPISMVFLALMYGVGMAPVYDVIDPADVDWSLFTFIVAGMVMDAVSGLVLVVAGALVASGRGGMAFAVVMIVFGVLSIVFSIVSMGIIGVIGGILGIVGGALSIKAIKKQEVTLLSTS